MPTEQAGKASNAAEGTGGQGCTGNPGRTQKIAALEELADFVAAERAAGRKIVHCHGVYDLVHIGHIKHLQAARALGDVLVVTITPDEYVDKGPHRPVFPASLRAEAIAALSCVDGVAINKWPTAVETIKLLKPDLYVKGRAREKGPRDHTDAIVLEEETVKAVGGKLVLTDEETYSASALINRHLDIFSPEAKEFLAAFRAKYSEEGILSKLDAMRPLRVLTVGESIIDEYQFCSVMSKANKDPILAARHKYTEKYAGGILAVANHVAGFCDRVGLLSMLGEQDSQVDFITLHLDSKVHAHFLRKPDSPTIVKRRFLEEYGSVKLFEVYIMRNEHLSPDDEAAFCRRLEELMPQFDVVVCADYGHGLFTEKAIEVLSTRAPFLAVSAQTNAGNRGFNMISRWPHADFISIDEPEARLETRDEQADIRSLIQIISRRTTCKRMLVTQGRKGTLCYDEKAGFFELPALAARIVDRIGAGDAVLALAGPAAALGLPIELVGFFGNVAGAEACGIMGNKSAINPTSIRRYVTSLHK
ncbi:MAG: PfkB family carbohydrate kinase [Planctomycetota bacterium]|nr:PfkB family carbohydrate kinase [Planctomycetota bacterium]